MPFVNPENIDGVAELVQEQIDETFGGRVKKASKL